MLEQLLMEMNNWFVVDVHAGDYTIEGGALALPFLREGQYFRICGSIFNDGLHQYPERWMTDESFSGTIWALAVPKAVTQLADEIREWQEKNGERAMGPYSSESFGGYSYSKATDAKTGGAVTWQSAFRARISRWRKI